MKKKIEALLKRLQIAVRHNPAEVVLSVLFCCFGSISGKIRRVEIRKNDEK